MEQCGYGDHASLYALGLLDETESSTFERHLTSCSLCAEEVRGASGLAVQLAGTIPTATLPSDLRRRVLNETLLPRGVVALGSRKESELAGYAIRGRVDGASVRRPDSWRPYLVSADVAGCTLSLAPSREPGTLLCPGG